MRHCLLKIVVFLTIGILYIGTLDGFTFDSDGEGDRLHELNASQNDPNNESEDQPKGKTKRKAAVKPAVWFLASLFVDLQFFNFFGLIHCIQILTCP